MQSPASLVNNGVITRLKVSNKNSCNHGLDRDRKLVLRVHSAVTMAFFFNKKKRKSEEKDKYSFECKLICLEK